MVDYKQKYLEMKLKYINAKNKLSGGSSINVRPQASIDNPPIPDTNFAHVNDTLRRIIERIVTDVKSGGFGVDFIDFIKQSTDYYQQRPPIGNYYDELQEYFSFIMNKIVNGWLLKIPGFENNIEIQRFIEWFESLFPYLDASGSIRPRLRPRSASGFYLDM